MQKTRVTQQFAPFDSLTFSEGFIEDVEALIKIFNVVSKNNLFADPLVPPGVRRRGDEPRRLTEGDLDRLGDFYPRWFLKLPIASVAQWIVSHFEVRIFK